MSLIQTNYAMMQDASSSISTISNQIGSDLDTLRTKLQNMDWEGDDREAYNTHQANWDSAIANLNTLLTEIGGAVNTACDNYMSTEAGNVKVWGI